MLGEIRDAGIPLSALNIGGGFPCHYTIDPIPSIVDIAESVATQRNRMCMNLDLILEPGRGIVADTCSLVASIIARIDRRGTTWLFLDAGVYNGLFEAMAYQGSTRYPVSLTRSSAAAKTRFSLAGPTGDGPDVIERDVYLPSDVAAGDRLIFRNSGAYTLSVASSFNGFPKPPLHVR
jgi:ornithine decarboxylase